MSDTEKQSKSPEESITEIEQEVPEGQVIEIDPTKINESIESNRAEIEALKAELAKAKKTIEALEIKPNKIVIKPVQPRAEVLTKAQQEEKEIKAFWKKAFDTLNSNR